MVEMRGGTRSASERPSTEPSFGTLRVLSAGVSTFGGSVGFDGATLKRDDGLAGRGTANGVREDDSGFGVDVDISPSPSRWPSNDGVVPLVLFVGDDTCGLGHLRIGLPYAGGGGFMLRRGPLGGGGCPTADRGKVVKEVGGGGRLRSPSAT